jgi:hypothetical protein
MDWHRLFGLLLTDYFAGSPFEVELEKDLSLQQQFLDVVILRRRSGRFDGRLPDGLDDLAAHNLITFKSHQEALDDWALKELTGHYVSYRKLLSRQGQPLLPEAEFRLYAVCSRFPHNLAQQAPWEEVQAGVYRCRRGTDAITVVVARELPQAEHNAPLHLFSAAGERVAFGARHYRRRSELTSTLLDRLFEGYVTEGVTMPYTLDDFRVDYILHHWPGLTPEQRRKAMLRLPPEERREVFMDLPPEERLQTLSLQEIEEYLRQRKAAEAAAPKQPAARKGRKKPRS